MKKDILAAIDEALAVGNRKADIEDRLFDEHQYVLLLEKALLSCYGPDWDPEDPDVLFTVEKSTESAFTFWEPVESCWNCGGAFTVDTPKDKLGMCVSCYDLGNENDEFIQEILTMWGEVDGIPIMRSSQTYKQHMFVFIGERHPFSD